MVRLSAPILTLPQVPPFSGSIEMNITAEDLPQRNAEFGKCHPSVVYEIIIMCASWLLSIRYCNLATIIDKTKIQNGSKFCT